MTTDAPARHDAPLIFFGLAAGASLLVSLPATAQAMQLTHGWGWWLAAVAVFELGAVGLELMTLAVPQWRGRLLAGTVTLLALTTGANYAAGADLLAAATLPPGSTYAAIRAAGYGGALALGLSALFPSLLFAFLLGLTARWRMLRAWEAADVRLALREQEVTRQAEDVARQVEDVARREAALTRAMTPIVVPDAPRATLADDAPRLEAPAGARQRPARHATRDDDDTDKVAVRRLVAGGLSAAEAAARVGVKVRTAQRWTSKGG